MNNTYSSDESEMKKSKIKVRRTWSIDPETKIKDSNKIYDRAQNKRDFFEELNKLDEHYEEELDDY